VRLVKPARVLHRSYSLFGPGPSSMLEILVLALFSFSALDSFLVAICHPLVLPPTFTKSKRGASSCASTPSRTFELSPENFAPENIVFCNRVHSSPAYDSSPLAGQCLFARLEFNRGTLPIIGFSFQAYEPHPVFDPFLSIPPPPLHFSSFVGNTSLLCFPVYLPTPIS